MARPDKKPKKPSRIGSDFKTIITRRGSIADLAAGVIIGGAFGAIISSLVNDMVMPLVGVLIGGVDFATLAITVGEANVRYGIFLKAILNFIIIAICVFVFVRFINRIQAVSGVQKTAVEDKAIGKKEDEQTEILKQIRDELKKQ